MANLFLLFPQFRCVCRSFVGSLCVPSDFYPKMRSNMMVESDVCFRSEHKILVNNLVVRVRRRLERIERVRAKSTNCGTVRPIHSSFFYHHYIVAEMRCYTTGFLHKMRGASWRDRKNNRQQAKRKWIYLKNVNALRALMFIARICKRVAIYNARFRLCVELRRVRRDPLDDRRLLLLLLYVTVFTIQARALERARACTYII